MMCSRYVNNVRVDLAEVSFTKTMLAGVKKNRTTAALPDHKAGDLLMVAVTVPSPSP